MSEHFRVCGNAEVTRRWALWDSDLNEMRSNVYEDHATAAGIAEDDPRAHSLIPVPFDIISQPTGCEKFPEMFLLRLDVELLKRQAKRLEETLKRLATIKGFMRQINMREAVVTDVEEEIEMLEGVVEMLDELIVQATQKPELRKPDDLEEPEADDQC